MTSKTKSKKAWSLVQQGWRVKDACKKARVPYSTYIYWAKKLQTEQGTTQTHTVPTALQAAIKTKTVVADRQATLRIDDDVLISGPMIKVVTILQQLSQ